MGREFSAMVGIAAALGLSACAQADRAEVDEYDPVLAALDTQRACFSTREIQGYSNAPAGSSRHERILIDAGPNESWLLETTGPCPELDANLRVALDVRGTGSVCTGDWETLLVPSSFRGDINRCPVRVLGRVMGDVTQD
ncbi:DUF6491 family protein [Aurantiacibacter rhizosphaerae]|uniref:Lipoprotein n=1 Tax=Aurantiacibacter rhizosphaerae TaxID=2691582 RepID=A0A844XHE5_9SPHN|nr:DUF6491 family protein [Aurantiacibacter rhizosphaerae]MWV29159.1 hypothetical protein [Aurantiacibacter rhizosphaerae]